MQQKNSDRSRYFLSTYDSRKTSFKYPYGLLISEGNTPLMGIFIQYLQMHSLYLSSNSLSVVAKRDESKRYQYP